MNYLHRLENWGNTHHPRSIDILRIALGIFLIYKAIAFLVNMSDLVSLMGKSNMGFNSFVLVFLGQFVVIVTLMSGILLILGLHTRIVAIVQIPILIGAIFLLRSSGGEGGNIWLTVITLLLLVFFLVLGNGPLSFGKVVKDKPDYHP